MIWQCKLTQFSKSGNNENSKDWSYIKENGRKSKTNLSQQKDHIAKNMTWSA